MAVLAAARTGVVLGVALELVGIMAVLVAFLASAAAATEVETGAVGFLVAAVAAEEEEEAAEADVVGPIVADKRAMVEAPLL